MSTELTEYQARFPNIAFERREGVLQIRLHSAGGSLLWGARAGSIHAQLGDAFHAVARDEANRAVILTGTGGDFCAGMDMAQLPDPGEPGLWQRIMREGRDLLLHLMDIPFPVVAAVNGPAWVHAEIPVLADIVLAAETASFADVAHFTQSVVPGDGAHVVWPMLLGPNRGRHFLLTGTVLSATQAHQLGVVAEVVAASALQERAWQVAHALAAKPLAVLRGTREVLTAPIRKRLQEELVSGLSLEGLGFGV
jgi:enoyl-CoA hydratase/carnithine racemase